VNDVLFSFGSSEVRCKDKCIENGPQAHFLPWLELETILFQPAFLSAFPLFYVAQFGKKEGGIEQYWRRSWREHDHWLTCELEPGNGRFLTSSHPWNVHCAHHSHTRSCFKDIALRVICC